MHVFMDPKFVEGVPENIVPRKTYAGPVIRRVRLTVRVLLPMVFKCMASPPVVLYAMRFGMERFHEAIPINVEIAWKAIYVALPRGGKECNKLRNV